MVFDSYTKSILKNHLMEAAFPDKPKENQVYIDPNSKTRYIYRAGSWKLWPKDSSVPTTIGGIEIKPQPSAGVSPAETPKKRTIKKPSERATDVRDIPQLVNLRQDALKNISDEEAEDVNRQLEISSAPFRIDPKETPEKSAEVEMVRMMSGDNYRPGFDPYQQTAWVNIRKKAEEFMSGLDASAAAKGMVGLVSPDAAQALDPIFKKFGKPLTAGAKQIVRKNLAKMYLGMTDKFEDNGDSMASEVWNQIVQNIPDLIPEKLKGMTSKGRFGDFGNRIYTELDNLTVAGEDPFEAALTATGANKAADVVTKQFTVGPASLETSAGYLTTGRKQGIYK